MLVKQPTKFLETSSQFSLAVNNQMAAAIITLPSDGLCEVGKEE